MNYFSKWAAAVNGYPSQEATLVAETLVTEFVIRFGVSHELYDVRVPWNSQDKNNCVTPSLMER